MAALITCFGVGGLVALRYAWARTRFGYTVSIVIAVETVVVGIIFIALASALIFDAPWINVSLRRLAQVAIGVLIAASALGLSIFIITRILAAGHQVVAAVLFGLLIPVGLGILIVGVRIVQDPLPVVLPTLALAPLPTLTPVPTSNYTTAELAFPSLEFTRPTNLIQPEDGTDRIFVTEQAGRILVFPNDQKITQVAEFLDVSDRVESHHPEQGLLGLAFDPNFLETKHFYISYTACEPCRVVVSRFSVSKGDPNIADRDSELVIIEIPHPNPNHNGGQLGFGLDRYLYISIGDGALPGDPHGNAQDKTNLLGSILRIDVSSASETERYLIPQDNPFVGVPEARDEIWAYGLRNTWRWSIDQDTGFMWAADAGQLTWEEVNIIGKGLNYGWNILEGQQCFSPPVDCDDTDVEPPVATYGRIDGCAIIGGFVYRGDQIPSLTGAYLYGDYCSGKIWALWYDGASITKHQRIIDTDLSITSFGQDLAGNVYILNASNKEFPFGVYRLTPVQ